MPPDPPRWRLALLTTTVCAVLVGSGLAGCTPAADEPPAAAAAGDRLIPELGNPGYDALTYGVDLTWLPEVRGLGGTSTISLRTTSDLDQVALDYRGARVDAARVDGEDVTFERADDKLLVDLPTTAPTGTELVLEVDYAGRPRALADAEVAGGAISGWIPTDDGVLAIGEPSGTATWTPVNEAVDDKALWAVRLRTPPSLLGVSGGELVERTEEADGSTTTTWSVAQPMSSYLAFIAVGEFETLRDEVDGTELLSFVQPGMDPSPGPELQGEITTWLADRYGPYPFDVGGFVLDDAGVDLALETQTRSVFDGQLTETLLVHELAHQWFGNAVTPTDWADIWLNEGFATYAEWRWRARNDPEEASIAAQLAGGLSFYDDEFWQLPPGDIADVDDLFSVQVYVRGAMTLAALELTIGTATIDRLLRTWVDRFRYGNASSEDFEQLAARISGRSLDGFFEEWLRTPGRPEAPQPG